MIQYARPVVLWTFLFLALASCQQNNPTFDSSPPNPNGNAMEDIKNYGDVLRDEITQILGDQKLTAYTDEFGPSVISVRSFPYKSEVSQAKTKPWSSWWYPKKDNLLFTDTPTITSTFAKYDALRALIAKQNNLAPPASAQKNESSAYSPDALPWEGLCDAWALAAISQPEPIKPVTMNVGGKTVTFDVGDLKALLLKTYEAAGDTNLKYYGQKFTGDINGWIYPDLFPEQFHRALEIEIVKNQRPFVMDHDPGPQIWNVPVYKVNFQMDAVPDNADAIRVTAWVYSAESYLSATDRSQIGTKEAVREYNYVLQGHRDQNGDLVVTSGYWIKGPSGVDSRNDHPDYIIQVLDPKGIVRKSWDSEVDINLIDQILAKAH